MYLPYVIKELVDDCEKHVKYPEISALYLCSMTIDYINSKRKLAGFTTIIQYMEYRNYKLNKITNNFEKIKVSQDKGK